MRNFFVRKIPIKIEILKKCEIASKTTKHRIMLQEKRSFYNKLDHLIKSSFIYQYLTVKLASLLSFCLLYSIEVRSFFCTESLSVTSAATSQAILLLIYFVNKSGRRYNTILDFCQIAKLNEMIIQF